jgi:hypothetical protein
MVPTLLGTDNQTCLYTTGYRLAVQATGYQTGLYTTGYRLTVQATGYQTSLYSTGYRYNRREMAQGRECEIAGRRGKGGRRKGEGE